MDSQRANRGWVKLFVALGVFRMAVRILSFRIALAVPGSGFDRAREGPAGAAASLVPLAYWLSWVRPRVGRASPALTLVPLLIVAVPTQVVPTVAHSEAGWLVCSVGVGLLFCGVGLHMGATGEETPAGQQPHDARRSG